MALSMLNFLVTSVLLLTSFAAAETRTYDFTVGWVTRNPDGQLDRPVIGINGEWPIPMIEADVGDRVVVNVKNDLGNQSTSLHFHGLYQNGTTHMDGVAGGTQCEISPGTSLTYNFTVNQPGTYWYHSHVKGQYPDGLRGPLIVHDPENPFADQIDEELVLTLSDWYHEQMPPLMAKFLSVTNPTGAEPVPQSALMNETQGLQILVEPGKTYFLRIVNMAAFAAQYFWIEGHTFRIIEVDGIYTEPAEAELIYLTAAQRYGILLTTKNETDTNFAIMGSMDQDLFDQIPDGLNPNVTSYLVYDASLSMPEPAEVAEFDPFDDMELVPEDGEELFTDPDLVVTLDVLMDNLGDGANYAFFSGITYVAPKVPTLYTALSAGEFASNASVYGTNTNSFVLEHNSVVEIVLNNQDPGKHPFHLHGHVFQTVLRGEEESGDFDAESLTNGSVVLPKVPMRRDVILVRPNGHLVMRFRADNPGVWVFHCHIEWHVDSGLIMTFVEAPLVLQETLTIPEDHYAACAAMSPPVATMGNAAGNTQDYLDLTGENLPAAPLPDGFKAKGIVALTFSIIAGLLGVGVIAWYGLGEMNAIAKQRQADHVQHIGEDRGVASLTSSGNTAGISHGGGAGADTITTAAK